jgi:hypothetical protein
MVGGVVEGRTKSWTDSRSELAYSKNKGTLSAAQNLTINANESITNGETIQNKFTIHFMSSH